MYTNKIYLKLLMGAMLLALLFTTACGRTKAIKGPVEEALAEQGNAFMVVLQDGDFQATVEVMSPAAQQAMDKATYAAGGQIKNLIMQNAHDITGWKFEDARIVWWGRIDKGILDGKVSYADGTTSKLQLELDQLDGTWKVRSFSLGQ